MTGKQEVCLPRSGIQMWLNDSRQAGICLMALQVLSSKHIETEQAQNHEAMEYESWKGTGYQVMQKQKPWGRMSDLGSTRLRP